MTSLLDYKLCQIFGPNFRQFNIKGESYVYLGVMLSKITGQKVMLFGRSRPYKSHSEYVIAEFSFKPKVDSFSVELEPVYYCNNIEHLEYERHD